MNKFHQAEGITLRLVQIAMIVSAFAYIIFSNTPWGAVFLALLIGAAAMPSMLIIERLHQTDHHFLDLEESAAGIDWDQAAEDFVGHGIDWGQAAEDFAFHVWRSFTIVFGELLALGYPSDASRQVLTNVGCPQCGEGTTLFEWEARPETHLHPALNRRSFYVCTHCNVAREV